MKNKKFFIFFFLIIFAGCSTYTITKDELVRQLRENQNREVVSQYIPIGGIAALFLSDRYPSNQIKKILCINSDGEKVYLFPGKDTQLEITKKSDGDVVKMYFDTTFLAEERIIGLRSRLIQSMTREVDINDIEKIEITDELAKTEPYTE